MKITDVRIRRVFETGPMKAIATVTFDDELAIHDIKIIDTGVKFFVVMPSRRTTDGEYKDIAHPINSAFRRELNDTVKAAYDEQKDEVLERQAKGKLDKQG